MIDGALFYAGKTIGRVPGLYRFYNGSVWPIHFIKCNRVAKGTRSFTWGIPGNNQGAHRIDDSRDRPWQGRNKSAFNDGLIQFATGTAWTNPDASTRIGRILRHLS